MQRIGPETQEVASFNVAVVKDLKSIVNICRLQEHEEKEG